MKPNGTVEQFRLRRTNYSDLDAICGMLATESVGSNHFLHRLRAKSSFYEQLSHRLRAIEEGRRSVDTLKQLEDECSRADNYVLNLLSVNNKFKTIMQKAVSSARESNAWERFLYQSTTATGLLHHVMITIEERISGDIVGFCEIGYLQQIRGASSEEERINVPDISSEIIADKTNFSCDNIRTYAPAILNLVVSSSHRRLGLASRLVDFAQKYTRTHLCQQNSNVKLGLYVHTDNRSAVHLYTKKGFQVVTKSNDGLLYMTV
jgi:ribosomal protein S18 acetylase RimI-like enzyme